MAHIFWFGNKGFVRVPLIFFQKICLGCCRIKICRDIWSVNNNQKIEIMTRATKIENGSYEMTIKGHTYRIVKGGNLNPGWWIWEGKKCLRYGKSKFNCEVFLNYGNPAYLTSSVKHFRY